MYRSLAVCLSLAAGLLSAWPALAQEGGSCASEEATELFREGFTAARDADSKEAMGYFKSCLEAEPDCLPCLYELGWVYWTRGSWKSCVASWEKVSELNPNYEVTAQWLKTARDNLKGASGSGRSSRQIPMGTLSTPKDGNLKVELTGRFQRYQANPKVPERDHYDRDVYSPKSARFSADGKKVYVNSLEGYKTVVYNAETVEKIKVIKHHFNAENEQLFQGEPAPFDYKFYKRPRSGNVNHFKGKPVESEISHGGKFLWVPYYRRSYDGGATSPSAVAIIDTTSDEIVRVMPTGPIPKYVSASPDGNWVAVTHWGDNTVALIDTSSGDPQQFEYRPELLVVYRKLSQSGLAGKNRDKACGYCLRGTVFTPDSKMLLVSRMGGGGIAGFDVDSGSYLGTIKGMKPTPRHLVLSPDGETLYLSSNVSGYVSKIALATVRAELQAAAGEKVRISGFETVYVGSGARTISLGPEGRYIFSAVNRKSELIVIDSVTMDIVSRIRTDAYTVGLAVSPDGKQAWTTSQGRKDQGGGNSVCVYTVTYPSDSEPEPEPETEAGSVGSESQ